jgi:hypothetical protein
MAFYRGLVSPVIGYGLIKAAAFGSYAQFKNLLSSHGWSNISTSPVRLAVFIGNLLLIVHLQRTTRARKRLVWANWDLLLLGLFSFLVPSPCPF